MNKKVSRTIVGISAMLPLLAQPVLAAEIGAQFRAGVGVSDNVARTANNEIDETILSAGFDLSITEETNRLDLDFASSFDFLTYADDSFDDDVFGGASGSLVYTFIDERFSWLIQDNFGQALFDPFEPARPDNRENVNFFTTGPTLMFLAGRRNPIILDVRYSNLDYEERPVDSDRLSGNLSFGRDISRTSNVSLNFGGERIEFDEAIAGPPVDRYEAFLRYTVEGASNSLATDIGFNEVESGGTEGDGLLFRVTYTRQTSVRGLLTLSGGSAYSDQGNVFRLYQEITEDLRDTIDGAVSQAPFQNDFITANYTLEHDRYSIVLAADWNREDYEDDASGIDRDLTRFSADFRRDMTRKLFAGARFEFIRREFDASGRQDDDFTFGVDVGIQATPAFSVAFEYQHLTRDSTAPASEFTENRAYIRFGYTPAWGR